MFFPVRYEHKESSSIYIIPTSEPAKRMAVKPHDQIQIQVNIKNEIPCLSKPRLGLFGGKRIQPKRSIKRCPKNTLMSWK